MICPVCEYPDAQQKWELTDRFFGTTREQFPLFECSGCGLLFQDCARVADRLADFYPEGYWWESGEGVLSSLEHRYREWMVRHDHVRFLRRVFPQPDGVRLLDIGCGSGLFVEQARAAGFEAWGLEAAERAVEIAHRGGNPWVMEGDESTLTAQSEDERFDVITLFHVLEHVAEPFKYLRRVQKLLRKPGHLVVQVPNRSSWQARVFGPRWYGLDCPRHLCNYSAYSVLYLLGRAGFRIQRVRYFSIRDNAPALVASLLPALEPVSSRVRRGGRPPGIFGEVLREVLFTGLNVPAQLLAWLEAGTGRGGTIMVHSTWDR
jgi:SAM-dependent methyltransferase